MTTFWRDPQYREAQERIGWTEAKCKEMDEKTREDHTYKLTRTEHLRYRSNWCLQLNNSGRNGSMSSRPDYRAAVALKNHLCRKSEKLKEPIPPQNQDRVREGNTFSETYRQGPRVDKKVGWKFWPSSSSSSISRFFSKTGDSDMNGPVMRESEVLVLVELPC